MKNSSLFKCTQQELYLAAALAWAFCRRYLPRFSKLKGFYTEGYILDRLADIQTAKDIPNFKIRKDQPTTNKILMDEAIEDCCYYFTMLKALISTAFEANLYAAKLDAAGQSYFVKSESGNEGALTDLNDTALKFIENNEATLKANNNMTDSFFGDYQAVVANYKTCRKNYTDSTSGFTNLTADNTAANNALYATMMDMLKDGQAIFRKEPELRDQCTFTNFSEQVVEVSVAGIRGRVKIKDEKKGINKVQITIEGREKVIETNKQGRFDIPQIAAGKYLVTFAVKGYKTVVFKEFEVKTGVYNTLNVEMEATTEDVTEPA